MSYFIAFLAIIVFTPDKAKDWIAKSFHKCIKGWKDAFKAAFSAEKQD